MSDFIIGLSDLELKQIANSLIHYMCDLNKDLYKSLKHFDFDEIQIDIQSLDDYSRLLNKIGRTILYRKEN